MSTSTPLSGSPRMSEVVTAASTVSDDVISELISSGGPHEDNSNGSSDTMEVVSEQILEKLYLYAELPHVFGILVVDCRQFGLDMSTSKSRIMEVNALLDKMRLFASLPSMSDSSRSLYSLRVLGPVLRILNVMEGVSRGDFEVSICHYKFMFHLVLSLANEMATENGYGAWIQPWLLFELRILHTDWSKRNNPDIFEDDFVPSSLYQTEDVTGSINILRTALENIDVAEALLPTLHAMRITLVENGLDLTSNSASRDLYRLFDVIDVLTHVLGLVDLLCNTIEWPVDVLEKTLESLEGLWAMVATSVQASSGYESDLSYEKGMAWGRRLMPIEFRVTGSLLRVSTLMQSLLASARPAEATELLAKLVRLLQLHLVDESPSMRQFILSNSIFSINCADAVRVSVLYSGIEWIPRSANNWRLDFKLLLHLYTLIGHDEVYFSLLRQSYPLFKRHEAALAIAKERRSTSTAELDVDSTVMDTISKGSALDFNLALDTRKEGLISFIRNCIAKGLTPRIDTDAADEPLALFIPSSSGSVSYIPNCPASKDGVAEDHTIAVFIARVIVLSLEFNIPLGIKLDQTFIDTVFNEDPQPLALRAYEDIRRTINSSWDLNAIRKIFTTNEIVEMLENGVPPEAEPASESAVDTGDLIPVPPLQQRRSRQPREVQSIDNIVPVSVVLMALSKGFDNYRFQSDICNAYKMFTECQNIPKENIVVMMHDDVANDPRNPFPGQLFNRPDNININGLEWDPSEDVYAGCEVDYNSDYITKENIMTVLTGQGRFLKPNVSETLLVFLTAHGREEDGSIGIELSGSSGELQQLSSDELIALIQDMHRVKMFRKRLLFVIESCFSGKLFEGKEHQLPYGVMVVTSCSSSQMSWSAYTVNPNVRNTMIDTSISTRFMRTIIEDLKHLSKDNEHGSSPTSIIEQIAKWDKMITRAIFSKNQDIQNAKDQSIQLFYKKDETSPSSIARTASMLTEPYIKYFGH